MQPDVSDGLNTHRREDKKVSRFKSSTGEEYDPNEVRALTMGGGQIRHGDELFEQEFDDWRRDGVPEDRIYMARPLLDGTPALQAKARKFLSNCRGGSKPADVEHDQLGLMRLLSQNGLKMGSIPGASDAEVMGAWDKSMGHKSPDYNCFILGKDRPELGRRLKG